MSLALRLHRSINVSILSCKYGRCVNDLPLNWRSFARMGIECKLRLTNRALARVSSSHDKSKNVTGAQDVRSLKTPQVVMAKGGIESLIEAMAPKPR